MIHKGILKSFSSGTYLATVQIVGSLSVWIDNIPVSRDIADGDMVAGRNVLIVSVDPSNPNDWVLVAVWT